MQEAFNKIRSELGSDAIMLSNRPIKQRGITGLFRKPLIEVVAAYENKFQEDVKSDIIKTNFNKLKSTQKQEINVEADTTIKNLESSIDSLHLTINNLAVKMDNNMALYSLLPLVQEFYQKLKNYDVCEELAISLSKEVQAIYEKGNEDIKLLSQRVLTDFLGNASGIVIKKFKRTIVMFVGQTGAGKTTTIAKIASDFMINQGYKIGLITADVYRVAAYEQLKTYADILNVPLRTLYNPEDLTQILLEYEDRDVVFIDTPGKSPFDKEHEKEIEKIISIGQIDEVHLVISAVTSFKSIQDIIQGYSFLKKYKIIITKIDESPTCAAMLNAIYCSNMKLSYISNGQSVPDNYDIANIDKIIKYFLEDVKYE